MRETVDPVRVSASFKDPEQTELTESDADHPGENLSREKQMSSDWTVDVYSVNSLMSD
jgi:hypothetical protein